MSKYEQFPPIEGNPTSNFGTFSLFIIGIIGLVYFLM